MKDREYRCSECLQLQEKEMESPYVCEVCESKKSNAVDIRFSDREIDKILRHDNSDLWRDY